MGVLKEDPENTFVLLKRVEEDVSGKRTPEKWGVSVGPFWLPTYSFIGACADWRGLMQDLNYCP
jgi:anaphase-promoting complex subunit 2